MRKSILMLFALFFLPAGCTSHSSADADTVEIPAGEAAVLMCGRSVMAGWFGSWGADTSAPHAFCDHTLYYGELSSPPEIVESFEEQISRHPGVTTVFFKLCFEDFSGGDREEAAANLARNKDYIRRAYATGHDRNLTILFGNALPKVEGETSADLAWNHREYNAFLDDFCRSRSDCRIFDFYGVLAVADGSLKPAYAAGAEDSHLNDAAYAVLNSRLCEALR